MADERDPKVSRHYRGLEPLEPARELDQTILAAARRAADAARAPLVAPSGRQRWYYSLAAAAVLVFAVALTVHMERERPDAEPPPQGTATPLRLERELRGTIKPPREEESKPAETKPRVSRAPESPQSFTPDPQPAARDSLAAAPAREESPSVAREAAKQPAPSPEAGLAAAQAGRADEARRRMDTANTTGALARRAPAPAEMRLRREETLASPYASAPPAAREKPERWLERIAELRSRGRHAEADKELAEFRRVYADYPLSELMRERVEGR
jgi:hypothetical protein